tara:strand:+ start:309 stop:497 length:189 start_codon:yes stop_codon:yes gene_type:complete
MNLHLSKEDFNKEIERLNNRIDFLCKHIQRQENKIFGLEKKIEDLKIINKLVKNKYKKLNSI